MSDDLMRYQIKGFHIFSCNVIKVGGEASLISVYCSNICWYIW